MAEIDIKSIEGLVEQARIVAGFDDAQDQRDGLTRVIDNLDARRERLRAQLGSIDYAERTGREHPNHKAEPTLNADLAETQFRLAQLGTLECALFGTARAINKFSGMENRLYLRMAYEHAYGQARQHLGAAACVQVAGAAALHERLYGSAGRMLAWLSTMDRDLVLTRIFDAAHFDDAAEVASQYRVDVPLGDREAAIDIARQLL